MDITGDKWLQGTGERLQADGIDYGYRVPDEVWNAAWHGNWPDDKETLEWILKDYLDVEEAKAGGYLELVLGLREEAEAALRNART